MGENDRTDSCHRRGKSLRARQISHGMSNPRGQSPGLALIADEGSHGEAFLHRHRHDMHTNASSGTHHQDRTQHRAHGRATAMVGTKVSSSSRTSSSCSSRWAVAIIRSMS